MYIPLESEVSITNMSIQHMPPELVQFVPFSEPKGARKGSRKAASKVVPRHPPYSFRRSTVAQARARIDPGQEPEQEEEDDDEDESAWTVELAENEKPWILKGFRSDG
jgi:hypothetical protein